MAPDYQDVVPYTCIYIDACWTDLLNAVQESLLGCTDTCSITKAIERLWTNASNPNPVIPLLSVRTGFDLFLRIKNYPPGSEIIMSAINIPDMVRVLKHHNLKIVPLDISIETCAPKVELIEHLVTERTVAILVAHIYGKWCDMEPIIKTAERHKLTVIEDCAESFSGFERIGHPKSDLALFSFGAIKFFTAFGGAIAKVSDPKVHQSMKDLYKNYPYQSRSDYINRVLKYSFVYILLNCPRVIKSGMYLTRLLGIDHKKHVVKMLRGFPSQLMRKIRHQPSGPLLAVMYERMQNFHASELLMAKLKGDYVSERLPTKATQVGTKAAVYNYWLFPIIVENPDEVFKALNAMGIDAYRGATQLNIVEPENSHLNHLQSFVMHQPHEAKFLIDHVVYIPVNKMVPFQELDRIIHAVDVALNATNGRSLLPLHRQPKVNISSKL